MKRAARVLLGALVATSIACGQGSADKSESAGSMLVDYVAHWDGYAEAHVFGDGSDRVRLVIDADGHGTLEVGDQPALPPATDPTIAPPGAWDLRTNYGIANLIPGFRYPVYDPRVQARRIRLGADYHDAWRAWCQLQTPVFSAQLPGYTCSPELVIGDDQGCYVNGPAPQALVPIDCTKVMFCSTPSPCSCAVTPLLCECTATACDTPRMTGTYFVHIDGALEMSAALVGTLAIDDIDQRFTIRLTRQ